MRRKNNYVMKSLERSKKVSLPNGRTFYAKYTRVPRSKLLPNAIMTRSYKRRAAAKRRRRRPITKGERGQCFLSTL